MENVELALLVGAAFWLCCRMGASLSDRGVVSLVQGLAGWHEQDQAHHVVAVDERGGDAPGTPTMQSEGLPAPPTERVRPSTMLRNLAAA